MAVTIEKQLLPPGLYIKIRPTYVCTYYNYSREDKEKTEKQLENEKNLLDNKSNGNLSNKAVAKLKNAVNWLICAAKPKRVYDKINDRHFHFRINFITLTIPPQKNDSISPKKIKALLNTWLSYHRKYSDLKNYVWKAEFHKDGRIHLHLTADTFIHWRIVRASWNRILQRNGLLEFHYQKFENYDPNSTDIHSTKNVKNLPAYIAKYMSKDNDTDYEMEGRIWGCNYALSEANQCKERIELGEYWDWMSTLQNENIKHKLIETSPKDDSEPFVIGSLYMLKIEHWKEIITGRLKKLFYEHLLKIQSGIPEISQLKMNIV